MLATFLALGEATNFLKVGFCMYLQRQGFCSLIFEQQSLDGGTEDVIAFTQELSCSGLHVTATETSAIINITNMLTAICDAFIFPLRILLNFRYCDRERDVECWMKMGSFASQFIA